MSNYSYPKVRVDSDATGSRKKTARLWSGVLENFGSVEDYSYDENFDRNLFAIANVAAGGGTYWLAAAAAGGTAVFGTGSTFGGEATLTATTGTAHYGAELRRGPSASVGGQVNRTSAPGVVAFETRVILNPLCVNFVGLGAASARLASDSTLTDTDYIGFFGGAGGKLTFVSSRASGAKYSVDLIAAADRPIAYHKLGFRVNPNNSVQIFVDGKEYHKSDVGVDIAVPANTIPTGSLTENFVVGRGGGAITSSVVKIDWVASHNASN